LSQQRPADISKSPLFSRSSDKKAPDGSTNLGRKRGDIIAEYLGDPFLLMEQPQEIAGDVDLIERIRTGDRSAEEILYGRYAARVYYLALKRVGSVADAEDVRSETFVRVLTAIRLGQLQQPGAFASFCFRTLDNVASEMTRQSQRTSELAFEPPAAPEREYLDEDVKSAIQRSIARLKPREREFLRMYYYDELPKNEIARRTGIAEERVRLLKSRTLKSFREYYQRLRKLSDTKRGGASLL
jgi:RNA polymerase sigma-70 factor (ECF subfamily)